VKKLSLLGVAALFVATFGFATNTRVATMGGIADFLIDDSNIYGYPAWVNAYTGNAIGELGAPTGSAFFATGFGNFGVALQRSALPRLVNTGIVNSGAPFPVGFDILPKLEGLYGIAFGPLGFGLDIEFAGNDISTDFPTGDTFDLKESKSILGVRPGFKFSLGEEMFFDFALDIHKYGWSYEEYDVNANKDIYKDKGNLFFGVDTRFFMPIGDVTFIPMLHFNMGDGSWEKEVFTTADTTSEEIKSMDVTAGIGLNKTIFENGTVLVGIRGGMRQETYTPGDTLSPTFTTFDKIKRITYTLPEIVFGAEIPVWKWLVGRVGFSKALLSRKQENTPQSGNYKDKSTTTSGFGAFGVPLDDAPFNLTFGGCAELGDFVFDVQIPNGFFFSGPYFISGTACAAAQASATYKFGK